MADGLEAGRKERALSEALGILDKITALIVSARLWVDGRGPPRSNRMMKKWWASVILMTLGVTSGAIAQTARVEPDVEVTPRADGVWLHKSW